MSNPSGNSSSPPHGASGNAPKKFIQWKSEKQRNRFRTIKNNKKSTNPYKSAKAEYERVKSEKKVAKERQLQRKQEIETALNAYKEKKKLKNKKLFAKTAKGQPVMKNRIEVLLDKIQQTVK